MLVVVLTACSTTQQVPIDDVYYWPAAQETGQSTQNNPSTPSTPSNPSNPSNQNSSTIEYVNVQDTTVTIRVK